jgi:hypothetical protein
MGDDAAITLESPDACIEHAIVSMPRRVVTLLPGGYIRGPVSVAEGWRVEAAVKAGRPRPGGRKP